MHYLRARAPPNEALSSRIKEVHMASHKYKVGQNVRYRPTRSALVGAQECKIIRQLPVEDGIHLYRVKCFTENVERVVKEGELAPAHLK